MELKAAICDIKGKDVRKIRKEGKIPAVVYGKHMDKPLSIICDKNEFVRLYRKVGSSTPITVKGKDLEEMVLIHDYQLDPVSDTVLHVDFLGIKKGQKVTAEVAIVMEGEELSPIVKSGDANIQLIKDYIEIEALPKDLPKEIKINVSDVDDFGYAVTINDLDLPNGVEVKEDGDITIVTVLEIKDIPEEEPEIEVNAAGEEIESDEEGSEENKEKDSEEKEKKEE